MRRSGGWLSRLAAFFSPETHSEAPRHAAPKDAPSALQATFDDLNRRLAAAAARVAAARGAPVGEADDELTAALAEQRALLAERETTLATASRRAQRERNNDTANDEQGESGASQRARIAAELKGVSGAPEVGALADRAIEQLRRQTDRRREFYVLVATRLNPSELTYRRYAQSVEGVHLRISENAAQIAANLRLVASIDPDELAGHPPPVSDDEYDSQQTQSQIRAERLSKVESLLGENEIALTALAAACARVVSMRELDYQGEAGIAAYIEDLRRIAERPTETLD